MRVRGKSVKDRGLYRLWNAAALALVLALVALFLASCGGAAGGGRQEADDAEVQDEERESVGQAAGASVAEIDENPSAFYGAQVTVSGLVIQLEGHNAFAIRDNSFAGDNAFANGGKEFVDNGSLLIVGTQPLSQMVEGSAQEEGGPVEQQDFVQVTGTVRPLNENIGNYISGYELDDQILEQFEGDPVVVASSVDMTPQQENLDRSDVPSGTPN